MGAVEETSGADGSGSETGEEVSLGVLFEVVASLEVSPEAVPLEVPPLGVSSLGVLPEVAPPLEV